MSAIIFLIVIIVVGVLMMSVMTGGNSGKRRGGARPMRSARGGARTVDANINVRERWATIQTIALGGAAGLKQSVMEADKLLDYALRQAGYEGETMGERLKAASPHLKSRDGVWRAHKLRNALAHEVGFDLVPSQAKEALVDFERGLGELGAL